MMVSHRWWFPIASYALGKRIVHGHGQYRCNDVSGMMNDQEGRSHFFTSAKGEQLRPGPKLSQFPVHFKKEYIYIYIYIPICIYIYTHICNMICTEHVPEIGSRNGVGTRDSIASAADKQRVQRCTASASAKAQSISKAFQYVCNMFVC